MLKQSTGRNVLVFMTDSADHVTGKTGLTLTITASKDGAAFAGIAPAVTERGSGWYSVALAVGDTDTLGDLALHITSAGADPTDVREQVFLALPGESVVVSSVTGSVGSVVGLTAANLDVAVSTLATAANLATVDTVVDAIKVKTDSLAFTVAGQVDANIQYVNDVLVTGDGQTGTEWGP